MKHLVTFAYKNIFRQPKRSLTLGLNYAFVSFILVLIFSFTAGTQQTLGKSMSAAKAGDLTISGQFALDGRIYGGLVRTPEIIDTAKALVPDAQVFSRYRLSSMVYYKGISKRLSFVGINAEQDTQLKAQMQIKEGSWDDFVNDPSGLIISSDEEEYFGLHVGDTVTLSARSKMGAFNTGLATIRTIYTTPNYFFVGTLITQFDFLRKLDLASDDSATSIYIYLPPHSDANKLRTALSDRLSNKSFEVNRPKDVTEAMNAISSASTRYESDKEGRNRSILTISTLDEVLGLVRIILMSVNSVGILLGIIILFVIAIGIYINLRMTITERMREIGTMRALGMERGSVVQLFVTESLLLDLIFSTIGCLVAVVVGLLFNYVISFPTSGGTMDLLLDNGHLIFAPNVLVVIGTIVTIAIFALIFSYIPAKHGGKISPVEALTSVS